MAIPKRLESASEMKKLMVESAAKLAHWLCWREMLLEERPEAYLQILEIVQAKL